jgi:sigma-E factor negative regulatory protein RseA
MTSEPFNPDDERAARQLMSDLADGRGDTATAAFDAWAREPGARQAWHAYHLIGDALRSDDLAVSHARDATFLDALRKRLADEPVVLAPVIAREAVAAPRHAGQRWALPAAAVAGVVVVAGVLVATRASAPPLAAPAMAAASAVVAPKATALAAAVPDAGAKPGAPAVTAGSGEPQWQVVDGKLIRDANLDRYLRAHRGNSVAVPGGAIGRFETVVLER